MTQLTSLIWSFLYVQAYLIPRSVSMKVKCLFQSSIYTIKISHSTLLIISQAPPRYRPKAFTVFWSSEGGGGGFWEPFLDYSKALLCAESLLTRGSSAFLDTISSRKSKSRVFLLRRTPSSRYCFYLYIAMQVYSSPNRRRQTSSVTKVQYRSGSIDTTRIRKGEEFIFLLSEEGSSQLSAAAKERLNLMRSFDYISCDLRIQGLWLRDNMAGLERGCQFCKWELQSIMLRS